MVAFTTQQTLARGPMRGHGWASEEITAYAEFPLTALATADTVDMLWVPNGAIITGVMFGSDDIDSNGAPTTSMSVGDATVPARLVAASAIGQTGGFTNTLAAAGAFFKYTADTKIRVTAVAGSATFAAGTIKLKVSYVIDPTLG